MTGQTNSTPTGSLGDAETFFLLGLGFQLVLDNFVARLDALGYGDLRPIHGLVFRAILSGRDTSTEVAEQIGVTKQAAGALVDYLERCGYVVRTDHPAGGRRRRIVFTERGAQHVADAQVALTESEASLRKLLPDSRHQALRESLVSVIDGLSGADIPPLRPVW